jgi:PHP family Zn ribbon phosphoesterase
MTAYRAIMAEREDIEAVTTVCPKCNSEVSIQAATAVIPTDCPSCGREYEQGVIEALNAFARFQKFAKGAEDYSKKPIFRFNIKQVD